MRWPWCVVGAWCDVFCSMNAFVSSLFRDVVCGLVCAIWWVTWWLTWCVVWLRWVTAGINLDAKMAYRRVMLQFVTTIAGLRMQILIQGLSLSELMTATADVEDRLVWRIANK